MFGSGMTICRWTLHDQIYVNVYKSEITKEQTGIDNEGMILVTLMRGGD